MSPTTSIFIAGAGRGIREVRVDEDAAQFFFDSSRAVIHGEVIFDRDPITVEAICSGDIPTNLPKKEVIPTELATTCL